MVLERYSRKLEIAKGEKRDPYNLIILQGPLYDIYTDSVKVNPVYYCFRLRIKNNNNKKVRIPVVAIVVDVVIFFISFHSFMFYYFMYFYNYFFFLSEIEPQDIPGTTLRSTTTCIYAITLYAWWIKNYTNICT